ncbi:MAG: hypothetical protein RIR12_1680 [Bacteroidota bacterium]|jgi:hypothetical protein
MSLFKIFDAKARVLSGNIWEFQILANGIDGNRYALNPIFTKLEIEGTDLFIQDKEIVEYLIDVLPEINSNPELCNSILQEYKRGTELFEKELSDYLKFFEPSVNNTAMGIQKILSLKPTSYFSEGQLHQLIHWQGIVFAAYQFIASRIDLLKDSFDFVSLETERNDTLKSIWKGEPSDYEKFISALIDLGYLKEWETNSNDGLIWSAMNPGKSGANYFVAMIKAWDELNMIDRTSLTSNSLYKYTINTFKVAFKPDSLKADNIETADRDKVDFFKSILSK